MTGGRSAKRKGTRVERLLVHALEADGIKALRVPLSGGGSIHGDILFGPSTEKRAEVKARSGGSGWKVIERWLSGNNALFLWRDRSTPLVVLPWEEFIELAGYWNEAAASEKRGELGDD